jgi:phospholipase/carboxylesterase
METFGPLRVRRARSISRTPRNDGDKPREAPPIAAVLLHGYGAPGDDLVALADALDAPGLDLFFPEGLLSCGPLGDDEARAWWDIDQRALQRAMALGIERDLSRDVPAGLARARGAVVEMLDAIGARYPEHRLVLGGFSQGAMLALDIALRDPRPLAGVALLSGTMLAEHEWRPLLPARRGLALFQSHGKTDPLLSYRIAERLHETVLGAGLDAVFHPFPGGHAIPPPILRAFADWLRAR